MTAGRRRNTQAQENTTRRLPQTKERCNMRHRVFSAALISAVSLLSAAGIAPAADTLPNILWLSTEDIGPHLGCYGDPVAHTPNLDRLAARGLRYATAWSNYPVCAPARTTIITGVYPAATGGGHMRCSRPLPPAIRMFPQFLREAGYYCTNNRKEDYNHPKPGKVWDESSGKAHYKNRERGQPFFAVFNYTGTHESRIRSRPHRLVTDPKKIHVQKYYPDIPAVRHDWAQYYDNIAKMDEWIGRKLDELKQAGAAESTIVVFFGDHGSGMPRHKRYPGDSGLRIPLIVYVPPKLRHLLPAEDRQSGVSRRLVSFVDLAPTMLSLAGIKPPAYMHGRAFLGRFTAPAPRYLYGFRGRMDERPDLVRSLRDKRYVYLRNYMPYRPHGQHVSYQFQTPTTREWKALFDRGRLNAAQRRFWEVRPAEELYDLQNDPDEVHNLAGNPQYRDVLERFRREHIRKTLEIRDVMFLPEATLETISWKEPPYTFARDETRYPLREILDVADVATRRDAASLPQLQKAAAAGNAVIRYWAAVGFLNRGKKVVRAQRDILRRLLKDPSPPVRVVAAEALGRYGDENDLAAALQTLQKLADWHSDNCFTAVAALNSIDALGDKAASLHAALKKLPLRDPRVQRADSYIARLIQTITGENVSPKKRRKKKRKGPLQRRG